MTMGRVGNEAGKQRHSVVQPQEGDLPFSSWILRVALWLRSVKESTQE